MLTTALRLLVGAELALAAVDALWFLVDLPRALAVNERALRAVVRLAIKRVRS